MVLLVLAVVALVLMSPFPRGFGAAIAISDHGKPQVVGANYSLTTSTGATLKVYLASGVSPAQARQIGCGLIRDELARAGLKDTSWVVIAASGEALANSSTICQ